MKKQKTKLTFGELVIARLIQLSMAFGLVALYMPLIIEALKRL